MFSLESFEEHIQALMEAFVEAAVVELRRLLLTECWRSGVSVQERSAAGEGGGEDREDRQQAVVHLTDQFISLMKVCTKDVLEKTTTMVKMSMCETCLELSTSPEDGINPEDRKKSAARRSRVRKGFQAAVTNHSDHLYCKEEQQTEESRGAETESESEIEPGNGTSREEMTPELSPAPDAASLSPTPESVSGVTEEDSVRADPKSLNISKQKEKLFQCSLCEKTFAKKCLVERHKLKHTKPHSCSHCGKRFATLHALTPHTRKHTGDKLYSCLDCGIQFAYKSTFDRHMRTHGVTTPDTFTHMCPLCEIQFTNMSMFQRHRCSALQRTFVCSVCPETFECRRRFADHEILHSANKDFVCEMCGERFLSSSSLATHRVTHFQGENCCGESGLCCSGADVVINRSRKKLLGCDICGKVLSHQSALKHHMLKHTGEKEYVCETCGKRCGHASALQNHMRVHTGKKPRETPACSTCGKTFASACSLRRHMIIHAGQKPHACSDCGKAFNNPSNLRNHAMIHCSMKMFGCNVCGRKFAQSAGLKRHRQLHVGKTFGCKVCGKGFVLKNQLRKHERGHLSEEAGHDGPTEKTDQI
ncbi:hypothetical protein ATANTOWER_026659 [Ataeniobius toweri]|uniref:C2H2-type domain-containing protein n=1 Tax=Ataeniobius toweri TaxID=208326 RepID=A0ABU7A2R3_9TELE|nr:hypothetical protein [Ataeniobius toweri]